MRYWKNKKEKITEYKNLYRKRFKIGDDVIVTAEVTGTKQNLKDKDGRTLSDRERVIIREEFTEDQYIYGKIVGIKRLRLGILDYDYDCGYQFKTKSTQLAWMVRQGMTNKEIYALDQDVIRNENPPYEKFPFMYMAFSEKDKEDLRGIMKEEIKYMIRDEKGRFVKIKRGI